MTETRRIVDDASLGRFVDELRDAPVIAVDTEFLTERTYYARLCLIQIAAADVLATIDPLACRDLSPLAELLAGPIRMVVHAGSQDLAILQRVLGAVPTDVFDTQIAAAFVGHGHSIGYARLVESCCGVRLKGSQAYTDWGKRPLDPVQLDYALDDVRYLLPVRDRLAKALSDRGRREWATEEFDRARNAAVTEVDPRQRWRRLSGMRVTAPRQLAVLQELAAWREHEAQRRDTPRQRVLTDRALLEIGRRAPEGPAQLEGTRGVHPNEIRRSGAAIVDAVRRGREMPADALPAALRARGRDDDPQASVAATLAHAYLKKRARELDLSSQLLANRADLDRLVRALADGSVKGDRGIRLLEGWRREVLGEDILALLAGKIGLRVVVQEGSVQVIVEDQEDPSPHPSA